VHAVTAGLVIGRRQRSKRKGGYQTENVFPAQTHIQNPSLPCNVTTPFPPCLHTEPVLLPVVVDCRCLLAPKPISHTA